MKRLTAEQHAKWLRFQASITAQYERTHDAQDNPRICPNCDAGDPTSIIPYHTLENCPVR